MLLVTGVALPSAPAAEPPAPAFPPAMNAAEIQLALHNLNVLGRVLYVAAHPDDENTNLMALWSNGSLYETAYLCVTRGDGGQNLIGPELGKSSALSGRMSSSPPAASIAAGNFSPGRLTSVSRKMPRRRCASGIATKSWRTSFG